MRSDIALLVMTQPTNIYACTKNLKNHNQFDFHAGCKPSRELCWTEFISYNLIVINSLHQPPQVKAKHSPSPPAFDYSTSFPPTYNVRSIYLERLQTLHKYNHGIFRRTHSHRGRSGHARTDQRVTQVLKGPKPFELERLIWLFRALCIYGVGCNCCWN
jgi:hypothetical protein